MVFGYHLNDNGAMLDMVHHAIQSSLLKWKCFIGCATATFLLLPNWKGLSACAYVQMLREHPETILGTVPQASVS